MDYGGRGPGGRRGGPDGPGDGNYGYYPSPSGSSNLSSSSSSSSLRSSLPAYALVLIILSSLLFTLIFVVLCVRFMCRKRRAKRAALRDQELQTSTAAELAWDAERDTARLYTPGVRGDEDADHANAKRCEAASVELTYVVMAGEEQPSFLARPALNSPTEEQPVPCSPSRAPSPPPVVPAAEANFPANPDKTVTSLPDRNPSSSIPNPHLSIMQVANLGTNLQHFQKLGILLGALSLSVPVHSLVYAHRLTVCCLHIRRHFYS